MAQALDCSIHNATRIAIPPGLLQRPRIGTNLKSSISIDEIQSIFEILEQSTHVVTHLDLLEWLQGGVQSCLPHKLLLAAWGDFAQGLIYYDVISPSPDIRTTDIDERRTKHLLRSLFAKWQFGGCEPTVVSGPDDLLLFGGTGITQALREAGCENEVVLLHGIQDRRNRNDCLYVLLGDETLKCRQSHSGLTLLLPHIDTALRRLRHLPAHCSPGIKTTAASNDADHGCVADIPAFDLSPRETEVLRWVGLGKTNYEIGIILNVSTFTVKNHLQRTFRKLNVMNRAQAVTWFHESALPTNTAPAKSDTSARTISSVTKL